MARQRDLPKARQTLVALAALRGMLDPAVARDLNLVPQEFRTSDELRGAQNQLQADNSLRAGLLDSAMKSSVDNRKVDATNFSTLTDMIRENLNANNTA